MIWWVQSELTADLSAAGVDTPSLWHTNTHWKYICDYFIYSTVSWPLRCIMAGYSLSADGFCMFCGGLYVKYNWQHKSMQGPVCHHNTLNSCTRFQPQQLRATFAARSLVVSQIKNSSWSGNQLILDWIVKVKRRAKGTTGNMFIL